MSDELAADVQVYAQELDFDRHSVRPRSVSLESLPNVSEIQLTTLLHFQSILWKTAQSESRRLSEMRSCGVRIGTRDFAILRLTADSAGVEPSLILEIDAMQTVTRYDEARRDNDRSAARREVDRLESLCLVANHFERPEIDFNISFCFAIVLFEFTDDADIEQLQSAESAAEYSEDLGAQLFSRRDSRYLMANILLVATRYAVGVVEDEDEADVRDLYKAYKRGLTSASRILGSDHPYLLRARAWQHRFTRHPALISIAEPLSVLASLPSPALSSAAGISLSRDNFLSHAESPSSRGPVNVTEMTTAEIVGYFGAHDSDTGRAEVQIALATKKILKLTAHLQEHRGDHSTRRGLLREVGRRRRLLDHLASESIERYRSIIAILGLRR